MPVDFWLAVGGISLCLLVPLVKVHYWDRRHSRKNVKLDILSMLWAVVHNLTLFFHDAGSSTAEFNRTIADSDVPHKH